MAEIKFLRLWDTYSPLLTPTQREITDLYFNLDLTVSEIAEAKGISRQGVSECLSSAKKQLEEYEEKLRFSENLLKYGLELSFMVADINRWAEGFAKANPEFATDIKKLEAIVLKDYSQEVESRLKDRESLNLPDKDFAVENKENLKSGGLPS